MRNYIRNLITQLVDQSKTEDPDFEQLSSEDTNVKLYDIDL